LVAWGKVCRLMELGGLGISCLKELGWALRTRWLWLAKTDPTRPWLALPIQVLDKCQAFFSIAMQTEIGDGTKTLFWRDRWLHGQRVEDLAPRLLAAIPKRRVNRCTVVEALANHKWISDIRGALTVGVIADYLHLWNALNGVELQPRIEDSHFWRLATNGQYSAKLAYEGLFLGSIDFEPHERVWKTWALEKCKFFMWLVAQNKCWTADRLARRGMDHPEKCLLCDQEEETIDHIMLSCVFATVLVQLAAASSPPDASTSAGCLLSGLVAGGEQKGTRPDQSRA
jgi:hypothetical protein